MRVWLRPTSLGLACVAPNTKIKRLFQSLSFKKAAGAAEAVDSRGRQQRLPVGREDLHGTETVEGAQTFQNVGKADEPSGRNDLPS